MKPKMIIINCPKCNKSLAVPQLNNEPQRQFNCPDCHKKIIVKFSKGDDGSNVVPVAEAGNTVLPQDLEAMQSCSIVHDGTCYGLSIGANHIGRKARTSKADIQVETNDMTMSREHIVITVSRKTDGNLQAKVRNDKNKNATKFNDMKHPEIELQDGDEIILHNGDHISMSHTEVVFQVVSNRDGDTTVIKS